MKVELCIVPPGGGEVDFSLFLELPCLPRVGDVVLITGQLGWGERKPADKSISGAAYGYSPEKPDYGMYHDDTPGNGTCIVRLVKWLIQRDIQQEVDWGVNPLLVEQRSDGGEPNHPGLTPEISPGSEPTLTKISVELEMADGPYNSVGFTEQLNRYRQRGKAVKDTD